MLKVKPRKKFGCLILIFSLVLIVIVAVVSGYFLFQKWYSDSVTLPNSDNSNTVNVIIKSGTSAADIGKLLKEKGLIKDELAWQIYVKLYNPNFLADTYDLPKNLSIENITKLLEKGQEDQTIRVTIPEGLRMDEVETILDKKLSSSTNDIYIKSEFHSLVTSPDTFLSSTKSKAGAYIKSLKLGGKSLEGFLFPDTYAFRTDVSAEDVLVVLLENFMAKTKDIRPTNGLTFYQNLILSSIVEREAMSADYSGVASVFLKRLSINEKLGSDITVLYILKRWNPEPTAKELLIESPYNTRKNYGIPPTPISNPGVSAILATNNAQAGTNLFFLADENGKIHYGKTLAEHEHNICLYLTKTCK